MNTLQKVTSNSSVDNSKLLEAIKEYQTTKIEMSNYIGESLYIIAECAKHKTKYTHPAYEADMVMTAVLASIECINKFDSTKSDNPHAYFTKICINSFHDTVAENTKQNAILAKGMRIDGVSTEESEVVFTDWEKTHKRKASKSGRESTAAKAERTWINTDGRSFIGITADLVRKFPEENLSPGALSTVGKGNRDHHKGWSIEK